MTIAIDKLSALWADIGSEAYWASCLGEESAVWVPFDERWPQPGFVGSQYGVVKPRIVLMGQNPRASNTQRSQGPDRELFFLIRAHAKDRNAASLERLFSYQHRFMGGTPPHSRGWKPIAAAERHLDLRLDTIAYLNLIPLATRNDRIPASASTVFARSTKLQIDLLEPDRIVIYGKAAYEGFCKLCAFKNVRYIEQRNFALAPEVRRWLHE